MAINNKNRVHRMRIEASTIAVILEDAEIRLQALIESDPGVTRCYATTTALAHVALALEPLYPLVSDRLLSRASVRLGRRIRLRRYRAPEDRPEGQEPKAATPANSAVVPDALDWGEGDD